MKAPCSLETPETPIQQVWRLNLQQHCCKNLKSHVINRATISVVADQSWCHRTDMFLIIMSNWYISLYFIAPVPYFNIFASSTVIACCTPSLASFYTVGLCCNTIPRGNITLNYCRQMNEIFTRHRLKVLVLLYDIYICRTALVTSRRCILYI
jgi:hypothetical protein